MAQTVATVEAGVIAALLADDAWSQHAGCRPPRRRDDPGRPGRDPQTVRAMAGARLDGLLDRLLLLAGPGDTAFVTELRAARKSPDTTIIEDLSDREVEVTRFLPTMLTATEIAVDLGVSVNTVKSHMRAIYRKLGVARRSEAVAQARRARNPLTAPAHPAVYGLPGQYAHSSKSSTRPSSANLSTQRSRYSWCSGSP